MRALLLLSTQFWMVFLVFFILLTTKTRSDAQENIEMDDMIDTGQFKLVVDQAEAPRYLLYDVNPGEGFNLRRDVYMRMAILVQNLNKESPWILVLPPWGPLNHWSSQDLGHQAKIPWSTFFDLESMRRFVPVLEFEEFLKVKPDGVIDAVYYLQNYAEGWENWEEKMDKRPCISNPYEFQSKESMWEGWFYSYEDAVKAKEVTCYSIMGHTSYLVPFLTQNATGRAIMLDRAETVLHDRYGNSVFWQCRRSMRFSKGLRDVADAFRKDFLDSTNEDDRTVLEEDWTTMKRKYGDALGGPYLGVHLRRGDFVQSRKEYVPSLKYAAKQLRKLAEKLKLNKIFIATDATQEEFEALRGHLKEFQVYLYQASQEVRSRFMDGGVAIIDQWICAHARYFIGTRESTFSFRIQDEREILGFDPDTTFNRLCRKSDNECEQPSQWKIEY